MPFWHPEIYITKLYIILETLTVEWSVDVPSSALGTVNRLHAFSHQKIPGGMWQ
jgi:hypothetical protein